MPKKLNYYSISALMIFGLLAISDENVVLAQIVIPGAGIINTVAGNGTNGYSGDGGPATSAELYGPNSAVVDSAGNIYIADPAMDRIRKVTATTGIITTVAGDGVYGTSGDGGPATSAAIWVPYSVAVDSSGNLYVTDASNRIRKITASTGIITTVAGTGTAGYSGDGGLATSAKINLPLALAVDTSGNVYIADANNARIRKVNVSTGIITTVAGNGTYGYTGDGGSALSAEISNPNGVAVDSAGNLYIGDQDDNVVRKVTASTGIISTVAGQPIYGGGGGYWGDGGLATNALLNGVSGVAVDSAGNIYIADNGNSLVRKVTASTGIIDKVAGNGTFGSSGDGGLATSAELARPAGVALDSVGNLYIADTTSDPCVRIVGSTTAPPPASSSVAYTYDSQGRVWTAAYTTTAGTVTATYTYDNAGNRTTVVTH